MSIVVYGAVIVFAPNFALLAVLQGTALPIADSLQDR